ncbi:MAG TPA: class I SAM-dependent methyltransferase [Pyrinomonadaceae bacterium]|nr:class I SAM-dependent methyltransferase [Pyrinomonadaceae bacterium]
MTTYRLNPYVSFVESRLVPGLVKRAVFHRLTNEIFEPSENLDVSRDGPEVRQLIQSGFLISQDYDPLAPLLDHFVTRPIQNPAVAWRSPKGELTVVRTSMEHTVYSRKRDELAPIVEEQLPPLPAEIFLLADGSRTLRQIFTALRGETNEVSLLQDAEFREAINFLTTQERQLIKLTPGRENLTEPYAYVNIVPRNLYHADRKDQPWPDSSSETITDFHLHDIQDATWEFDLIEPTINHIFRFPHEALGGLDYGSRFCIATLTPEIVPSLNHSSRLDVLEVGGGTGMFAQSFLKQAASLNGTLLNYHILDLSPALMTNQRKILSEVLPESRHFHQNATEFDLPDHSFDLIVSNEVIADFPVAAVQRNGERWEGEGAYYVEKYDLADQNAPDSFMVNAGAFRFLERAWKHLNPGGTLIVSEYGAEQTYPLQCYHLNHEEYSIHFGHLVKCATKIGFECRLLPLQEFLQLDDKVPVLNGREEHLLCLNHVLKNYGRILPYALISKTDFEKQFAGVVEETGLIGYSFSPLRKQYHFGPNIKDFLVLIMNKPGEKEN